MKRDLDLVREILLAVEKYPNPGGLVWQNLEIENHSREEIILHIVWLEEAGYIKLYKSSIEFIPDEQNPVIERLTWPGCEFLDTARDDARWSKAKEVSGKLGSVSFEILKMLLFELAKQAATSYIPGLHF